ncbi:MAG: hypothetical protein JEY99_10855 [Spirochaetales bacterium]|nr:hypothetical protein [Spirochaetales bacterium]
MKKITSGLFLFLLLSFLLSATDGFSSVMPDRLIGMNPLKFMELLGPPDSVYPLRGEEEWQDDVVFFYEGEYYLYLYQNRIWQVRMDENSRLSTLGVQPGLSSAQVAENLNMAAEHSGEEWEIYFLAELPYPLRLRVFYREGRAVDFYLYRGDF